MNNTKSDLTPVVLYEDNHLLAVNKQPGIIIQQDESGDYSLEQMSADYIRIKYNKPGNAFLGVAHRIDRPVSGVVLFARTSKALGRLNEMLRNREVRKTYWAVVSELPPETCGKLVHHITRNTKTNKSRASESSRPDSKEAILEYKLLSSSDRYHLLEIELITGRHHQIRAQLSAIGCPIRGDIKYGYPRTNENGAIHLHARRLELIHPVSKEELSIIAPPPSGDALWDYFCKETKS